MPNGSWSFQRWVLHLSKHLFQTLDKRLLQTLDKRLLQTEHMNIYSSCKSLEEKNHYFKTNIQDLLFSLLLEISPL